MRPVFDPHLFPGLPKFLWFDDGSSGGDAGGPGSGDAGTPAPMLAIRAPGRARQDWEPPLMLRRRRLAMAA
jgi:hypothetical protein